MLPPHLSSLLLLALPSAVRAVFQDEVGHIDFHYELLGIPQRETTFFHRPRREDKASLLYTLSDAGVLGAVNPSNGAVLWRQFLTGNITNGGGHLRAGEGAGWLCSAIGNSVHGWDAISGRNTFWADFGGEVKDLEIVELTEDGRKDALALFEERGTTILRRLHGTEGSVIWEFRETTKNIPLQVSTNIEKVFVVSLHGSPGAYNLKVSVLDTLTGKRLDDLAVGAKGDIQNEKDVMFVGANSAAPIVAWTDETYSKLRVNVLGTKAKQEFPLAEGTVAVEVHAPHLVQSEPHFLVHSRSTTGNQAEVFHVNLKTNAITSAYQLPHLPGHGAFSTSSSGANVFFTRITEDEMILTASTSHGILARWPVEVGESSVSVVHAVSEVIKKSADSYAVRSAVVTDEDDWTLLLNGQLAWTRPEGLSGAVAAAYAEIPEDEELAKTLEQEAHSNPFSAYIHRVRRHIKDLQYLPDYLSAIPQRLISSILGTDMSPRSSDRLFRDSFGFNKLAILATRRGKLYGLDVGNHGKILWSKRAFEIPSGQTWDVKGVSTDDFKGLVTVRGADGEYIVVKTDTGKTVEIMPPGSWPPVRSTALVDSPSGKWLLPVGKDGKVGEVPAVWAPKQIVVVQGPEGELKGLTFVPRGDQAVEETMWTFSPPANQRIVNIATRPLHDPISSIGRVLGDRTVKYKYLNPNTLVVAAASVTAPVLSIYLLDTVSGQILSSATYDGVDTIRPVHCAIAENWYLCSFFGQYSLRDNPTQSLKGHQVVVSDLYESDEPNNRGPLGNSANFSSLDPVEEPTAGALLPSIVTQSFVIAAPISALAVTQTRQGISSRQLLAYLPQTHGVVALPRAVLDPRRPVGRDPTPGEIEEGLIKYTPVIEIDARHVITHERDVIGVQKIITSPTIVESTVLILAYGVDVFGSRVAPSLTFDILGKGFNKLSLILTVLALMAGVTVLGPMVRRKQINARWRPF